MLLGITQRIWQSTAASSLPHSHWSKYHTAEWICHAHSRAWQHATQCPYKASKAIREVGFRPIAAGTLAWFLATAQHLYCAHTPCHVRSVDGGAKCQCLNQLVRHQSQLLFCLRHTWSWQECTPGREALMSTDAQEQERNACTRVTCIFTEIRFINHFKHFGNMRPPFSPAISCQYAICSHFHVLICIQRHDC